MIVVLADELVDPVEAPSLRDRPPAPLEELGISFAGALQLEVGPLEPKSVLGQLVVDLAQPFDEPRHHRRPDVRLERMGVGERPPS